MRSKKGIKKSTFLIALCWLVYTCSYIGKLGYNANIAQIETTYNVTHAQAGMVSTFFFFAYGAGQIFNGLFCKKYNLQWIIFICLIVSSVANLIVALSTSFAIIKYVWLINGFSMSVLWPSLVRLLSETLSKKDMGQASVVMGTTVAVGTFVVYGLSAVFVKFNFQLSFFMATVVLLVVAIVWVVFVSRLIRETKASVEDEILPSSYAVKEKNLGDGKKWIFVIIVMLAFYGIITNLVKDGLTTWVPVILKEQYHLDESLSIVLTLALPVVSIFGNVFAIHLHKKIPDFVMQCAFVFFCSCVIIGGVIGGLSLGSFLITLIGFAVVCFLASSCNTLITSIFPLFMKDKVNSGLIAGILNGFCYVGSTVSSYGLGAVADVGGWDAVFWLLFALCAFVTVVGGVYKLIFSIKAKHKKSV